MFSSPEPQPYPHIPSLFNSAKRKADREFQDLLKMKFRDPQDARVIRRECTRALLKLNSAKTIADIIAIYDTAEKAINEAHSPGLPMPKARPAEPQQNAAA